MSGYPYNNYGYGAPSSYGAPPPPSTNQSYGGAPPYGAPQQPYGAAPPGPGQPPYGSAPSAPPYSTDSTKPPKEHKPSSASAPPSYGGAPPPSASQYGGPPPPSSSPYGGAPPSSSPYGAPPQSSSPYAAPPQSSSPYGAPPPSASPYGAPPPSSLPYGAPPPSSSPYGAPPQGYGSPFASLVPSAFPPGTDPNVVACFQMADQDGSGFIDDKEMQSALSSYNQSFSMRTVHLLMYTFTNSNVRKIGPKEFTALFYSLQNWRSVFERFDRDRSGKIDISELREALLSQGFSVSPVVLDLLVSKFDKTGGKSKAIEYDNFIECCLTVKGLTEKFKEKDTSFSGSATFSYEAFMLTVLPFLIA